MPDPRQRHRLQYQALGMLGVTTLLLLLPGGVLSLLEGWLPAIEAPVLQTGSSDKLVHGVLFALCGFTAMRAWGRSAERWIYVFLALSGYGAATEILQLAVPGRAASAGDLLADVLGALAGIALGYHRNRRRESAPATGL